jgi:hypothetical protein
VTEGVPIFSARRRLLEAPAASDTRSGIGAGENRLEENLQAA